MILLDLAARPVIGHRGASGECPENTFRAFDVALRTGADALELDVRASADGVPVVIHDATVDRTTDGTGPVANYPLAALRELDSGAGERIPTLAEVLERYPDVPLIIDLKERGVAELAVELLRRHTAFGRVLVGSFEHAALRPASRAGVPRAGSRREVTAFWIASRLRLPALGARYEAFTVPEWNGRLRVVDARFVRRAQRGGLPVHVWTVNRPEDAKRLWEMGVAGIITNFPALVRGVT